MTTDSKPQDGIVLSREVEVIVTDDKRLKTIGEAFSNDVCRKILIKIFQGFTTALEISKELNASLPLVVYHLEKLLKAGLIHAPTVKLSRKGRPVKHYAPLVLSILIVPAPLVQIHGMNRTLRKAVIALRDKLLLLLNFVASTFVAYLFLFNTLFRGTYIIPRPLVLEDYFPLLAATILGGFVAIAIQYILTSRWSEGRR